MGINREAFASDKNYNRKFRSEIDTVKQLLETKYFLRASFDVDEVYSDPTNPGDISIYLAVAELLEEGKIRGPQVSKIPQNH